MSRANAFATLHNSEALSRDAVPRLTPDQLAAAMKKSVADGARVSAFFGDSRAEGVELTALLADDAAGHMLAGRTLVTEGMFPSLTPDCPQVHLFEREIAEQTGLVPVGHPGLKPVRFAGPRAGQEPVGVMNYYRVDGAEVHEVAVGPVHAGIIEPGHFRFQCHGEQVFQLEISLGYQHRGIEAALNGGPNRHSVHLAETLAGDTTIGHATALCQIMESLSGAVPSPRAQAIRGIALELERLANHAGDLGALANDVGFLPTASYCGRLRGDFLNMTAVICGNRFGRGLTRPGGIGFDIGTSQSNDLLQRLQATMRDLTGAVNLLWDTPSVMARFEDTGRVSPESCRELGLVGPAARACGIARDVRHDLSSGIFQFFQIPVSSCESGDVFARAYVRWLEAQQSARFIEEQLQSLPKGSLQIDPGELQPNAIAASLVEGWRGEICHVGLTDQHGRFRRYKVVDPSFHNWSGLALALRNQQISDFPLCNKSFNLSYCGFDL